MPRRRRDDSLPLAVATHGGLIAALIVLMAGTIQGTRAWIVLAKAGTAFVLSSAFLKLVTAGVMQAIRWKATAHEERRSEDDGDSGVLEDTVETIRSQASIPETTENPVS